MSRLEIRLSTYDIVSNLIVERNYAFEITTTTFSLDRLDTNRSHLAVYIDAGDSFVHYRRTSS